jgi:Gpi18-like mannosyltransferase
MSPIYFSGLSSAESLSLGSPEIFELLPFELFWSKMALVLAFGLAIFAFHKLGNLVFGGDKFKTNLTTLVFATSPFAFFAVGIFNQYDVFGVLFTLLGLIALTKDRLVQFALFFGLAASFKYFALIIAIPLILLFIPNWGKRIKSGLIILATPFLFAIPYLSSETFREGVLRHATDRVSSGSFLSVVTFTFVFYLGINLWAWHIGSSKKDLRKAMVIITIATYALLFNSVSFHPQWLVIITPFLALALGYIRHVQLFLVLEVLAFAAFVWYVLVTFKDNVDGTMVMNGPLSSVFHNPLFPVSVFFPPIPAGIGLLITKALLLAAPIYLYVFGDNIKNPPMTVVLTASIGIRAVSPLFLVLIPALIPVLL